MASTESTNPHAQNSHGALSAHQASGESPLHEGSNVHLRPLVQFAVWFTVALVVIHLIILSIFFAFRSAAAQERQITGVNEPRITPPAPRLQPSLDHNRLPAEDLVKMQAAEQAELKARGLLDADGKPMWTKDPEDLVRRINNWSK